jgi:hypothetical protein
MDENARAALVAQVEGLPLVIARNVPKVDFGTINPALQDKLAQAMAAQSQDEFALAQATPQELQAQAAQQEAADKAAKRQEAQAQQADKDKAQRDAVTQRSQAAADTFTLGGDAEQNLSGQQDIFADPVNQNSAAGITRSELSLRGQNVGNFVDAVLDGKPHSTSLRVGVISQTAANRIAEQTGAPTGGAVEVVIADSVVYANKRHPDLTRQNWRCKRRKRAPKICLAQCLRAP